MTKRQELLTTWQQLKIKLNKRINQSQSLAPQTAKRISDYNMITFQVVQVNIKKLQEQAEQVGKQIFISDKPKPKKIKSGNLGYEDVEVGNLFKEKE